MKEAMLTMGRKAVLSILVIGTSLGTAVYYASEHPAYAELAQMTTK